MQKCYGLCNSTLNTLYDFKHFKMGLTIEVQALCKVRQVNVFVIFEMGPVGSSQLP